MAASLLLLWFFTTCFLGPAVAYHDFKKFKSSFKHSETINPSELLEKQLTEKNANVDHFPHTKNLLAAIREGKLRFDIVEERTEKQHINGLSSEPTYEELTSSAIFKVTTTYQLYDANYFNLDDAVDVREVTDVARNFIRHCPVEKRIKEGDYFVGSSAGGWMHRSSSNIAWKRFSTSPVGLNFIRVVEGVAPAGIGCFRVTTRDVHVIELFDTFDIQARIKRPYSIMYFDGDNFKRSKSAADPNFQTEGSFVNPDSPLRSCTDPTFSTNKGYYFNPYDLSKQMYQYSLGATVGCASLQYTVPGSFNFNYNANTGSAINSNIALGGTGISGLSCQNCYVFMGAEIVAAMNYFGSGSQINFEAKLFGGVGVNINVVVQNPSVQGSTTITLLGPSNAASTIPLGGGLNLQTKFNGLSATISGSGSATGSASFGGGASASAYMGIMYQSANANPWTYPNSVNFQVTPPYMTYTNFQINNIVINVVLNGDQNFNLYYGSSVFWSIGAGFDVVFGGTAQYNYGPTSSVEVTATPSSSSSNALGPGDTIQISVAYINSNPNEIFHLFYAINSTSISELTNGAGINIHQGIYTSSSTGFGTISLNWTIPWDANFFQAPGSAPSTVVSVTSSTLMSQAYQSQTPFAVVPDHRVGIFVSPTEGEVVPADSDYEVNWNSELLATFVTKPGTGGHGEHKITGLVHLAVVAEYLAADGFTVLNSTSWDLALSLQNNGTAIVQFPSALTAAAGSGAIQRFYLTVRSQEHANIYGWSTGFFSLLRATERVASSALRGKEAKERGEAAVSAAAAATGWRIRRRPMLVRNRPMPQLEISSASNTQMIRQALAAEAANELIVATGQQVQASSCSTGSVSLTATVSGTIQNVYCFNIPFRVNSAIAPLNLYGPTSTCLAPVAAPVVTPTAAPNSATAVSGYFYSVVYPSTVCGGTPISVVVYQLNQCVGSGTSFYTYTSTGVVTGGVLAVQQTYYSTNGCTGAVSAGPYTTNYATSCTQSTVTAYSASFPASAIYGGQYFAASSYQTSTLCSAGLLSAWVTYFSPLGACNGLAQYTTCPASSGATYQATYYTAQGCQGKPTSQVATGDTCTSSGGTYAESCQTFTGATVTPTGAPVGPSPMPTTRPSDIPTLKPSSTPTAFPPTLVPTTGPTAQPKANGYYYQQTFASTSCSGLPISVTVYALGICTGAGTDYSSLASTGTVTSGKISVVQSFYFDSQCTILQTGVSPVTTTSNTTCSSSTSSYYAYSSAYPVLPGKNYYAYSNYAGMPACNLSPARSAATQTVYYLIGACLLGTVYSGCAGSSYAVQTYASSSCTGTFTQTSTNLATCSRTSGGYAQYCVTGTGPTVQPTAAPVGPSAYPTATPTVTTSVAVATGYFTNLVYSTDPYYYQYQYYYYNVTQACTGSLQQIITTALGICSLTSTPGVYTQYSKGNGSSIPGEFQIVQTFYSNAACTVVSSSQPAVYNFYSTSCSAGSQWVYSKTLPVIPGGQYYITSSFTNAASCSAGLAAAVQATYYPAGACNTYYQYSCSGTSYTQVSYEDTGCSGAVTATSTQALTTCGASSTSSSPVGSTGNTGAPPPTTSPTVNAMFCTSQQGPSATPTAAPVGPSRYPTLAPTAPTNQPTNGPPAATGYAYCSSYADPTCSGYPTMLEVYALGICSHRGTNSTSPNGYYSNYYYYGADSYFFVGSSTGQVSNGVLTISEVKYTDGTCSTLLSGTEQTTLPATCSDGYQCSYSATFPSVLATGSYLISSQFASGSSYCSVYGVQGSYRSEVYATGACIASDGGSFQLSCSATAGTYIVTAYTDGACSQNPASTTEPLSDCEWNSGSYGEFCIQGPPPAPVTSYPTLLPTPGPTPLPGSPTLKPTSAPTRKPTAKPTPGPTYLPGSPTPRPSSLPSLYPTPQTFVTDVLCIQVFTGISLSAYTAQSAASSLSIQQTVVQVVSQQLNIFSMTTQQVVIGSVITSPASSSVDPALAAGAARGGAAGGAVSFTRRGLQQSTSGIQVTYTVSVPLTSYSTSAAAYSAVSTALTTSVTAATFQNYLVSYSSSNKAASLAASTAQQVTTFNALLGVPSPAPTTGPPVVASPSAAAAAGLTGGAIAAIVLAIVFSVVLAALGYVLYGRYQAKAAAASASVTTGAGEAAGTTTVTTGAGEAAGTTTIVVSPMANAAVSGPDVELRRL